MKKLFFISFTLVIFSCTYLRRDSAITYNNSIIDVQSKILEKMNAFANSFSASDSAQMKSNLDALNKTLDSCLLVMRKMGAFDGSSELKEAGLHLFEFYKKTAENDYIELVNILKKTDFTEEDKNKVDEINARISKEEEPLDAAIRSAQENLSNKYRFKLDRNVNEKEVK